MTLDDRTSLAEDQVMTIFRSRLRHDGESAYRKVAAEMETAARAVPGFIDFKMFIADDGERVSLITFATPEAQRAWRDDPGHQRAQHRGRDEFYVEYSVQVGHCTHLSQWTRPTS